MTFNVVLYVTTSHMDYDYLENVKYQYTEKYIDLHFSCGKILCKIVRLWNFCYLQHVYDN